MLNMSLNGRIALVAVVALLALPLWLPFSPLVYIWWRRKRKHAQAKGLRVLNMIQANAIVAHAEASLPTPPADGWFAVARNIDRYLATVDSPRHWRSHAVLVALEFAPCLRLRAPLSRLPLEQRRAFMERHLATTKGLMAIPALSRQLIRMGYYTDPGIAQALGFRTMQQRRTGTTQAGKPSSAQSTGSSKANNKQVG
ncbi:MAG: hypothetical protein ACI89X_000355 [Planctomycetota bacterium]|jgi:hypothetical protein